MRTLLVIVLLAGIALLQGCALSAPYPDWMLQEADPYIARIEYLSDTELQGRCTFGARVSGCTKLLTGEIYILDSHSPEFRDCVLRHERSHVYDVYVKGLSFESTQQHEHWVERNCYVPAQAAAVQHAPAPRAEPRKGIGVILSLFEATLPEVAAAEVP